MRDDQREAEEQEPAPQRSAHDFCEARAARDALLWLLPVALVLGLQLRALDYGFVWTDAAEYEQGSVLRPPGELAHAFLEPLHRLQDLRNQPFSQPYYRPLQVVVSSALANHFAREPRSFRSVSLALACATCALFAALAARLLASRAGGALGTPDPGRRAPVPRHAAPGVTCRPAGESHGSDRQGPHAPAERAVAHPRRGRHQGIALTRTPLA